MSESLNKQILSRSNDIMSETTNIPIKEYIVNIRNKYYPDLDISFMDFFMDMYTNNQSVSVELLSTYGVLSIRPNRKTLHCNDVKRLFKRCYLKENEDYDLRCQLAPRKTGQRGASYKDMYYLTPKAFKICLISSENETKYRDYYLFLEECIYYYNIGQLKSHKQQIKQLKIYTSEQDNIIMEKEDSISRIEKIHKEMIAKLDKQHEDMQKQHEDMQKQNEILTKQHEESKQQMSTMQGTLDKIVKKLDDRAVPPSDDELTERFVLMKKDTNVFYVIRTQERRLSKVVQEKEKLGYQKIPNLIESELIPNSIYLWNCIRDELVKDRKIKCKYNEIILRDISEIDLVNVIKQVFDSRKVLN